MAAFWRNPLGCALNAASLSGAWDGGWLEGGYLWYFTGVSVEERRVECCEFVVVFYKAVHLKSWVDCEVACRWSSKMVF